MPITGKQPAESIALTSSPDGTIHMHWQQTPDGWQGAKNFRDYITGLGGECTAIEQTEVCLMAGWWVPSYKISITPNRPDPDGICDSCGCEGGMHEQDCQTISKAPCGHCGRHVVAVGAACKGCSEVREC